jgi:hypothetical protein
MKYTEYVHLAYVLQKREQTYRRPSKTPPSTPRIREAFHRNIPSLESQQHRRRILFGSASKRGSVGKARAALCAAGARAREVQTNSSRVAVQFNRQPPETTQRRSLLPLSTDIRASSRLITYRLSINVHQHTHFRPLIDHIQSS